MQAKARNDLARLFAECTSEAGLTTGAIDAYSTPRRLALIARDVAEATEASREELKGPRSSAPPQALEGFLRKTGLRRDQLEDRDGVLFRGDRAARARRPPKSSPRRSSVSSPTSPGPSRCAGATARCAGCGRCTASSRCSARTSCRSRSRASRAARRRSAIASTIPGPITIGGARDYIEKLRACHVIVDQDERERLIREGAEEAAAKAG